MSEPFPTGYLNGEFVPLREARISPFDRAFLFGDGVYEVIPIYGGRLFRLRQHLERLDRSLAGIRMRPPMSHPQWAAVFAQLIARNAAMDAHLYLQVTRGAEYGRNHAWPQDIPPTLFAYLSPLEPLPAAIAADGIAAITAPDNRWARRDIKSTALLGNVLLKQMSRDAGAFETIMLEHGCLTEGSSTTVHVVERGVVHTPPNGHHILQGTTRDVVTELAAGLGLETRDTQVSEARLRGADEIWLAFSTRGVLPVTRLDGAPVGGGRPGPLFKRIDAAFWQLVGELATTPAL
jgi:D-alanine transaminase